MKKFLVLVFILLNPQLIIADEIISGPKTLEEAKKKLFTGRELDPVEGIWFSETEQAYYAIVRNKKFKAQKIYETWTIIHKIDKFNGTKDPNNFYTLTGRTPDKAESFACSTTIYNTRNPSEVGVSKGICRLDQSHTLIKEYWKKGCWNSGECWSRMNLQLEMHWPRNHQKHLRNQSLIVIGISIFLIGFMVFMVNLNRKNLLLAHNQNHKLKFKTYSEFQEYKKKIEEKESLKQAKKEEKERKAEEAKLAKEAKAEEIKIKAEEKRLEREEKRNEKTKFKELEDDYDDSLMDKVKRLKSLYNNGTLTKAEFEKAKNKLLK